MKKVNSAGLVQIFLWTEYSNIIYLGICDRSIFLQFLLVLKNGILGKIPVNI